MDFRKLVKRILEEKENIRYRENLARKQVSYGEWAAAKESGQKARKTERAFDFVLFCAEEGHIASGAAETIGAYFEAHPEVQLLYGDEDVQGRPGSGGRAFRKPGSEKRAADRRLPWYKPDWSPELLDSFFYFGSLVALRRELLERASVRPEELGCRTEIDSGTEAAETGAKEVGTTNHPKMGEVVPEMAVYRVRDFAVYEETMHRVLELAGGYAKGACCVGHVESILFHGESPEGQERFLEASPFLRSREDKRLRDFRESLAVFPGQEGQSRPFLSLVIPSRDHPEVLERCLRGCLWGAQTGMGTAVAADASFLREDASIGRASPGGGKTTTEAALPDGKSVPTGQAAPVGRTLPFEIIVVDNGSTAENRERTEQMLKKMEETELTGHRIHYLYRPMEFNFSRMCNLGAAQAQGDFLLFLNDDVELCQGGTLVQMAAMVAQDGVGAVGLKLYYPDSRRIQHAGITNLPMGPVHKLQFLEDDRVYYYGANRGNHNVLAVTAACLMVAGDRYREAKGFPEDLRVAFNDVDFCFRLYEAGYRNVCMDGLCAWHHESLSRGDDESAEKLDRLSRERERLYRKHPGLEGKDPYYGAGLSREGLDTGIRPAYLTAGNVTQKVLEPLAMVSLAHVQEPGVASAGESIAGIPSGSVRDLERCPRIGKMPWDRRISGGGYRPDACVLVRVEDCRGRRVLGYGVVLGDNNACYDRMLLLWEDRKPGAGQDGGKMYALKLEGMYRPDLEENMPDQRNVALCGFDVELGRETVPAGRYRLGLAVRNRITGLGLQNWSNRFFTV